MSSLRDFAFGHPRCVQAWAASGVAGAGDGAHQALWPLIRTVMGNEERGVGGHERNKHDPPFRLRHDDSCSREGMPARCLKG